MAVPQLNPGFLRRRLLASICGGLTLVVSGLYLFRYGELDEQKALLAQKQSEAESIHRNLHNSAQLLENLENLQSGLGRLEAKLMRSGDVASYQQFFFKLETDSHVKLIRLQPATQPRVGQGKLTGAYRPMSFDASVDGTFAEVGRFLCNLESGPRIYRPVSFSVRRGGAQGSVQSDLVNLTIDLELLGSQ